MTEIRPLLAADIPAVAAMFQRIFRKSSRPAPPALGEYLRGHYLDGSNSPDIASQVFLKDGATVAGFIGVTATPMLIDGRPVRAALCSSFMVDDAQAQPLIGARLMRTVLRGPQDLSFGETASATTTTMWRRLQGTALPSYSLDWLRVINPMQFMASLGARRVKLVGLVGPFAGLLDSWMRGSTSLSGQWILRSVDRAALRDEEISEAEFATLARHYARLYRLAPAWGPGTLERALQDSAIKSRFGDVVRRAVVTPGGHTLGIFIYHARRRGIGHVLQILAEPEATERVVDRLFIHAADMGLAALRGRAYPTLLATMLGRDCIFINRSSTVVATRDAAVLGALTEGKALVNGLAGETWSRLNGHDFG